MQAAQECKQHKSASSTRVRAAQECEQHKSVSSSGVSRMAQDAVPALDVLVLAHALDKGMRESSPILSVIAGLLYYLVAVT